VQDWRSKFACIGSVMTTSPKVWIPYLVNSMSTHQWEEFKMAEINSCNFRPTWKLTSRAMVTKVLQITSLVHVCSLGWAQRKKWMPIKLMGCVYTHQGKPTIEGCGSLSYIWSVVEKIKEDNRKVGKIGGIISQAPTPRSKIYKIQAWCASNIMSRSMLKNVWWCKCSKMEPWKWTICCSMNCSKVRKHTHVRGDKRSHVALRWCCWLTLRFQEQKGVGWPWT